MKNDDLSYAPVYYLVFILFCVTACAFFVAGRSYGIVTSTKMLRNATGETKNNSRRRQYNSTH